MESARKKDRHSGVITTKYVDTLQDLCKFTSSAPRDITDVFNELRRSLNKGSSKASTSSNSRRTAGRRVHTGAAFQDGRCDPDGFDRLCTCELGVKQCWLVSELQPWNRVLSRSCVELFEHSWGELTIRGLNSPDGNTPGIKDILQTSVLVHLLLRQHRCVTRILMDQAIAHVEMPIFWHALQNGGAGVRYIKFIGPLRDQCRAKQQWLDMLMWSHSVICLPVLDSLHVSRIVFDENVAHTLGSYLLRTTTLKCIDIQDVQVKHEEATVFLGYLAYNETITSLKLHDHFVTAREGETLAFVLKNHVSLEQLEISGTHNSSSAILRAAPQCSSLKSLTLRSFTILAEDIERLEAALMLIRPSYARLTDTPVPQPRTRTSRLESLAFFSCTASEPRLQRAYAALIGGVLVKLQFSMCPLKEVFAINAASRLRTDTRLRVLDVRNNGLPVNSINTLVRALKTNSTLERMSFDLSGRLPELEVSTLFNTITEVDASSRIQVEWYLSRPMQIARFGGLCRISSCSVDLDKCPVDDATTVLESLTSTTNATSVCILGSNDVEDVIVQQLVNALGKTKSVRTLNLLLDWPEDRFVQVLRSLEQNRSVSVLTISGPIFRKMSATALARLMERNRMLNKISVHLDEEDASALPQVRIICKEFKQAVPRNRFLTSVALYTEAGNHASDFAIKDALRRNKELVNQAAHFVVGSNDKKEALAFETLQYSHAVLRKLCNGDEESDKTRAKEQIDEARKRLALNYFIFTRVVKAKLVCRPHPKRKPTFAKLDKRML